MCVLPPGKRQDLFKSELIPKVISEIEIKTQGGGDQRLNECACVKTGTSVCMWGCVRVCASLRVCD